MEERVSILRGDLVEAMRFLEELVVSLDRIGSATAHLSAADRAVVLERYVDEWNVFGRASLVRRALGEYFSEDLGPDEMDDLERELEGATYWAADAAPPDSSDRWWRDWLRE